jgi:hypothetical protein
MCEGSLAIAKEGDQHTEAWKETGATAHLASFAGAAPCSTWPDMMTSKRMIGETMIKKARRDARALRSTHASTDANIP